jgi:hybrid cluster-associated redox disulfide protein
MKFKKGMTIGEALNLHPEAGFVLSSFHIGGCKNCGINELETIEQVCDGYGIKVEDLLDNLNYLFGEDEE